MGCGSLRCRGWLATKERGRSVVRKGGGESWRGSAYQAESEVDGADDNRQSDLEVRPRAPEKRLEQHRIDTVTGA